MKKNVELRSDDLKISFNNLPDFKTTKEIPPYEKIIGQKRAEKSIDLGLKMQRKGYNIYISGGTGTGKTGYIVKKIEEFAKGLPEPEDLCYVYNFEDENNPMAISLKTGTAHKFKDDMSEFIKYLFKEAPAYFNSQSYEMERNNIMEKYEDLIINLNEKLHEEAASRGFGIKKSSSGEIIFVPMKNKKQMEAEEYAALADEEKDLLNKSANELKALAYDVIKATKDLKKKLEEVLKKMDDRLAQSLISDKICDFIKNYGSNEKVTKYLLDLKKDIVENIYAFIEEDSKNKKKSPVKIFVKRYEVNVFVSNNQSKGAPVVFADSVEFASLFGKVEYENKSDSLNTDFSHIRPGSLHLANGGFLIIKAEQLLTNALSWETLKRCLNLEIVTIGNSKNTFEYVPVITLNPEGIPLKTKVIMLGSNYIYSALLQRDQDFEKLFRIKAEFNSQIENDDKNIFNLIGFISNYIQKNDLLHISRDGVEELLKYSTRLVEKRNYFTTFMNKFLKIVDIADYFAQTEHQSIINKDHIIRALKENEEMHSLIRKRVLEMYKSKKYVVELSGTKIGQINGLSVSDYGDCVIGQQHKITVKTFAGRRGIVNIERETKMSGSIHSKGIMILSGFIGELLGQETQISFNASIVFEQLYSGIEGDSASAAELLALLSKLSDIPLKQSLAITGSVNQQGEIQPIGGVNQKIEGYFDICSLFGLDGSHGVIIPDSNKEDLVLEDRVVEAVEKGLFHIYTVSDIWQCFKICSDGNYRADANENVMDVVKKNAINKLKVYNGVLNNKE
jgi:lon-related putative ATP-dependent protease